MVLLPIKFRPTIDDFIQRVDCGKSVLRPPAGWREYSTGVDEYAKWLVVVTPKEHGHERS
jgi:hypothetical protein